MLHMSFCEKGFDRNAIIDAITHTDKQLLYTYGYVYRNPTTCRKPISVEEAVQIVKKEFYLDVDEYDDHFHLNAFSSNDIW